MANIVRQRLQFATLLATLLLPGKAVAQNVDLTLGHWIVFGVDDLGISWDGSLLVFTGQADPDMAGDSNVEGYFDWIGSNGSSGREVFQGTFTAANTISLEGVELQNPSGIVLGIYFAEVTTDGIAIVNGSWTCNGSCVPSDDWSAIQAVVFTDDFESGDLTAWSSSGPQG